MKGIRVSALCLAAFGLMLAARPALAQEAEASAAEAPAAEAKAEAAPAEAKPVEAPAPAEKERAKNSVYVEGLGAGLLYSFNYERLVIEDLAVRGGFSYQSFTATAGDASAKSTFITLPVTASYLGVGSKHHIFELGGGMTFMYASGSASGVGVSSSGSGMAVYPDLLVGYRLHPVDGAGFNFRVGAMAFVGKGLGWDVTDPGAVGVLPWFYLSLGASF
ncbi:MAG: hypothetical protein QM756_29170 [Polyangiaceae bacterium]